MGGEEGYIQPWIEFGRHGFDFFFGISGMAIPPPGSGDLTLVWLEFNTGKLLGTVGPYQEGAPPAEPFKLRIFGETGFELINGLNDLVVEELPEDVVAGVPRGDPRMFHFPDGQMGVLIERLGIFYKLNEVMLDDMNVTDVMLDDMLNDMNMT